MNPLIVLALQEVLKIKSCEGAVVAGGAVRDYLLGQEMKDIDIFVPVTDSWTWTGRIDKEICDAKVQLTDLKWDDNYYLNSDPNFLSKFDCKFMGIDIDLCAYRPEPVVKDFEGNVTTRHFGDYLVERFNFDISKCWYDGKEIHISDAAQRDFDNSTITISRLSSLDQLPATMKKFASIQEKYPDYRFNCPVLEIKKIEKKETIERNLVSELLPDPYGYINYNTATNIPTTTLTANRFREMVQNTARNARARRHPWEGVIIDELADARDDWG